MPDFSSLEITPPKMHLVNLTTEDELEAQFNPTELEETIAATWTKQKVQGFSSTIKQFTNTEDLAMSFTLRFDANGVGPTNLSRLLYARSFLMAACYPRALASSLESAGAPRLLFVWPGLISMTCVLTNVTFSHKQFNRNALTTILDAKVSLEEIRDTLLTSEDVLAFGTDRGS